MIILVTGGRNYTNKTVIRQALEQYRNVKNILITGWARGADKTAHYIWTNDFHLPAIAVPAPWDRMGKAAGMSRNAKMISGNSIAPHANLPIDGVIAFPGGKGTEHTVNLAKEHDIPVWDLRDAPREES